MLKTICKYIVMGLCLLSIVSVWSATTSQIATHIIRFVGEDGAIHYGQYISGNTAQLMQGDLFGSRTLTNKTGKIVTLLSPVADPPEIYAIGLNYKAHTKQAGFAMPYYPQLFFKNSASLNNPFGEVVVPKIVVRPDYEGELAIVIGKTCKNVKGKAALSCILGYSICNDVTARCWQKGEKGCPDHIGNGGQWSYGKSFDTSAPIGPQLVTRSVLNGGGGLKLKTQINGVTNQSVNTDAMIFNPTEIVAFLSQAMTLRPGSVICTGTPAGVGDNLSPPSYLKDGDVMAVRIDKIGTLVNKVNVTMETPKDLGPYLTLPK